MMFFLYFSFFFFFMNMTCLISVIVSMIFISIFCFMYLWSFTGSCWFPIIFILLFVGGILVLFMVVSSLFPNTKIYFPSLKKKIFFSVSLFFFLFNLKNTYFFNCLNVKYLMVSGGSFFSFLFLILCYFFSFLYFISKDKVSLRSFF